MFLKKSPERDMEVGSAKWILYLLYAIYVGFSKNNS